VRPFEAAEAVRAAAAAFEARWTLRSLRTRDPELFDRFEEQRSLFQAALMSGVKADIEEQTGGMVRAWAAATARMQDTPDDAYMIGRCPRTGLEVRIGHQLAAQADGVVHMTPDEVAVLVAGTRAVASLKQVYPHAILADLWPGEPAKGDA